MFSYSYSNTIYFIYNDIELAEEGIEQVKIVAKRLSSYPGDIIITSDMQRAIQTAEIIKENINRDISIHKIKDTHEITSANILHGHKRDSEHVKNIRLIEEENSNNEDFKLEGRESTKEIKSGVCQFLDYLSSIEHDNAIVVTR